MSNKKRTKLKLSFIHALIIGFILMLIVGLFVTKFKPSSIPSSTLLPDQETETKDYTYRSKQSLQEPTPISEEVQVIHASPLAYIQIPLQWYVYGEDSEYVTFSNRPHQKGVIYNPLTATSIDCTAFIKDPAKDTDQSNFYNLDNTNQWFKGKAGPLGGGGTGSFTREEVTVNGKKSILEIDTWLTAQEGDAPRETKSYMSYIGQSNKVLWVNCTYKPSNVSAEKTINDLVGTLVIAE